MEAPGLCSLPLELLSLVLAHLDDEPPSERNKYSRPGLSIINSRLKHAPLKSLSRVCKHIRCVVLPLLFKHTIHLVTAEARDNERARGLSQHSEWPDSFYEFMRFMQVSSLGSQIRSFTIAVKDQAEYQEIEYHDSRRSAAMVYAYRWHELLLHVAPLMSKITLIASSGVLGTLIGSQIYADSQQSARAPYLLLSISQQSRSINTSLTKLSMENMSCWSLLKILPWSGIVINDGSLTAPSRSGYDESYENSDLLCEPLVRNTGQSITNVTYVSIYPCRTHIHAIMAFLGHLPKLQELRFSLIPREPIQILPDVSPISRERVIVRCLEEAYPKLMFLIEYARVAAETLRLDACFLDLNRTEWLDRTQVGGFPAPTIDPIPVGWQWQGNSDSGVLVRSPAS